MAKQLKINNLLKSTYILIILFLFSYTAIAYSQQADDIDNQIREISNHLMCPVCSGQSVSESNAQLAKDMRLTIRQQLEDGKSKEQILAYFVERYGENILSSPPAKGFNILIWILPIAGIIIIGFILGNYLYKSKKDKSNQVKEGYDDSKFKNIEDELKDFDA